MTKDRLHYRLSRKHAHGTEEVERAIGITSTRYAATAAVGGGSAASSKRPVALLKWAFDDYVVEEELPADAFVGESPASTEGGAAEPPAAEAPTHAPLSSASESAGPTSFVLQVLSEGVPDTVIEKALRERLPRTMAFHFLSPVDFVSCASRYVWLRCGEQSAHVLPRAFWGEQRLHTASGEVFLSPLRRVRADANAPSFPPHLLPRTRYTVTLRNVQSSLGDVLPQLRSVACQGFLNYSHVARHGVGLSRIYDDAKLLLQRDYPLFLAHHLRRLTEGTTCVNREMPLLLDVLASPRSSASDWKGALSGIEYAVRQDAQVYSRTRQSGLYPPHHELLVDFVQRAADIMPRHHDSAQLIREAVKPLVLQETLHAITDVHFNASASLRWQRGGAEVAVGDLVCAPSPSSSSACGSGMDCFAAPADHINGVMTSSAHAEWSRHAAAAVPPTVKLVATRAEAAQYTAADVVLPTFGKGAEELLSAVGVNADTTLFASLVRELRVDGLAGMQLASPATFRPLLQRPDRMSFYVVDEKRGWDWEEDAGSTALKKALYHDQDGVLRYRSPLARRTRKNMVARAGIRDETARNFFLKPARKPGMTCVMQLTLPPGTHVTSAIREVFTVATVSPSAVFRMMAK